MRTVIFDFNRTLYNPDSGQLMPGTKKLLLELKKRGFQLILISRREMGRRASIKSLGLDKYFSSIVVTQKKGVKIFKKIIRENAIDPKQSFVVGDRAREEIAIGNALGFKTIWFRQGVFAYELPQSKKEKPSITVLKLRELKTVLR